MLYLGLSLFNKVIGRLILTPIIINRVIHLPKIRWFLALSHNLANMQLSIILLINKCLVILPMTLAVAGVAQQGHLPCGSPDRATPRGRYTQQGFSRINTDFLTQRRKGAKTLRFLCYVAIRTISISRSAGREMDFAATLWFVS